MNLAFSTAMDLEQLQIDADRGQQTVINLVDREAEIRQRLEDLAARTPAERRDGTAELILEAEGLIEIQKGLKEQINRVQKRIEDLMGQVKEDLHKEVGKRKDKTIDTENFELKSLKTKPLCSIDGLKDIPKRYRREPAPIPPWKEWEANKNLIIADLSAGKEVKGASLKYGYRLSIKRK